MMTTVCVCHKCKNVEERTHTYPSRQVTSLAVPGLRMGEGLVLQAVAMQRGRARQQNLMVASESDCCLPHMPHMLN